MVPALLFALGSGMIVVTGTALAFSASMPSLALRVAAAGIICQAALTSAVLVSGVVLKRLDGPTLVSVAAVQAVVALLLAHRHGLGRDRLSHIGPALRRVGAAVFHPVVLLPLAALIVSLAWRTFLGVRLPVLDFDGLSYHLVTVDVWLQSNGIVRVPQKLQSEAWPANGELITLWLTAFWRDDTLADLTAVVSVPLLVVSVIALARTLGAPARLAALAGLVVGIMPAVIALAPSTYVDTLGAADATAGWAFGAAAFAATGRRRRELLVLTGISMGLAVGVKHTFALPAVGLTVALALAALAARDRTLPDRLRTVAATLVTLGVAGVLFGGYWYAQNLVHRGNPVWPFAIGPFAGPQDFSYLVVEPAALVALPEWLWTPVNWLSDVAQTRYAYDTRIGGFGVAFPVLLALGAVGFVIALRSQQRWAVLAIVIPALITLNTMPMGWWARYTLFFPAIVAALAGVALARLRARPKVLATGAVLVLAFWSLGVATLRSNLLTEFGRSPPWVHQLARLALAGDPARTDLGVWPTCGPVPKLPAGSVVATHQFSLVHTAVGPRLERRLPPPVAPRGDLEKWHAGLRAVGATHVAIGQGDGTLEKAQARPDLFEPLGASCRGAFAFEILPG